MRREAIVLKASVFDSLPTYGNRNKKERDVWFSVLASYKNNIYKNIRVPISPYADSVDMSFLRNYIAKKTKVKADNVLFKEEPLVALLVNNITVTEQ